MCLVSSFKVSTVVDVSDEGWGFGKRKFHSRGQQMIFELARKLVSFLCR